MVASMAVRLGSSLVDRRDLLRAELKGHMRADMKAEMMVFLLVALMV